MPRSNRPRRRQATEDTSFDVSRALVGFKRTEQRRDGSWWVQPLTAANAVKVYVCPGCGNDIAPGIAHVVTWRADGIMGEAGDLADRRHWHSHCWKTRS